MTSTPAYLFKSFDSVAGMGEFYRKGIQPDQRRAGLEEEIFLADPQRDGLPLVSHTQNLELERRLVQGAPSIPAEDVSLEPGAHMIETKTGAYRQSLQTLMVNEIERNRTVLLHHCGEMGIIRTPYSMLSHASIEQAVGNLIERVPENPGRGDRQRTLMRIFNDRVRGAGHYPVCSTGVQYTHGATDADELLEIKRVFYALAPLIYNLFDNSPPFVNGARQDVHPVIDLRIRLNQQRGLIDKTVFEAKNGSDYINRRVSEILDKELMVVHDDVGAYKPVPSGETVTLQQKMAAGEGTQLLFLIAQLQGWPFLKDKLFHSEKDGFYGIGNEIRDLGNCAAGPAMAAALFAPIVFDREFRRNLMRDLERTYGFSFGDPAALYRTIVGNMQATHKRHVVAGTDPTLFLNAPLGASGSTQIGFMRDCLLPALVRFHGTGPLADTVKPLQFIADTGLTDSQFFRDSQKTLADTVRFMNPQHGYDQSIFMCARKTMGQLWMEGRLPQLGGANAGIVKGRIADAYGGPVCGTFRAPFPGS